MRPITIADLLESSEEYKRLFKERKLKYMTETEATDQEFLMREFELWDNCIHMLNFEKNYHETDWYDSNTDYIKVLVEGITTMGFDKVYYPTKRKLEYVESLKVSGKNILEPILNLTTSIIQPPQVVQEAKNENVDNNLVIKSKNTTSPKYYLRSVCIAIQCMGVTVESPLGRKILRKYFGNSAPPALKNNVVTKPSEITSITKNKNKDKWRKTYIEQATRLLTTEKNQKAIEAINQIQQAFQVNWDNFY